MKSSSSNEIKRGQAISFRVPSDTPDHLLKHLQRLKEVERRNFSSKMAEFVLRGVSESSSKERETITVPLPHKLNKSQRDWLKHEHSETLLGAIVYQLLIDPIRATALLTSLNSNSININEALYLQEDEEFLEMEKSHDPLPVIKETAVTIATDKVDDLDAFEWDSVDHNQSLTEEVGEPEENDLDSLLGDFLSKMNK
ncbi:hypothetical protein ABE096_07920 [Robertmurraya massiliosenegalensis]|uniref:hypothetical protein n=1 Tax=Robertmurraya TaxID=2837507 RepID=UPI0039A64156